MRTRKTTLPTSALPALQVTPPMVPPRRRRRGVCCRHHQRRRRRRHRRRRTTHKSTNRHSAEPKPSFCNRSGRIFERGRTTKAPPWSHPTTSCSTSTRQVSRLLACRRVSRASFGKLPSTPNSSHYLHRPAGRGRGLFGDGEFATTTGSGTGNRD